MRNSQFSQFLRYPQHVRHHKDDNGISIPANSWLPCIDSDNLKVSTPLPHPKTVSGPRFLLAHQHRLSHCLLLHDHLHWHKILVPVLDGRLLPSPRHLHDWLPPSRCLFFPVAPMEDISIQNNAHLLWNALLLYWFQVLTRSVQNYPRNATLIRVEIQGSYTAFHFRPDVTFFLKIQEDRRLRLDQ